MSRSIKELHSKIELSENDKQVYAEIVQGVLRRFRSFEEVEAVNVHYREILTSDKYSFDVKRQMVFRMPSYPESRFWGFRNLTGEQLFIFLSDCIRIYAEDFTVEEFKALIVNPAFRESIATDFNSPLLALSAAYGYVKEDRILKQMLIDKLVTSPNMNLEFAAVIMKATDLLPLFELIQNWKLDVTPVLNWARETYSLGENIPDSWVRELLAEVKS